MSIPCAGRRCDRPRTRFMSLFRAINQKRLVSKSPYGGLPNVGFWIQKNVESFFQFHLKILLTVTARAPCTLLGVCFWRQEQQLHNLHSSSRKILLNVWFLFLSSMKQTWRKSISLNIYWRLSMLHVTSILTCVSVCACACVCAAEFYYIFRLLWFNVKRLPPPMLRYAQ